ncbi:MAG: SpoIIE family protein phosphatase [Desulfovibrionaceae bacterium]
MEPEIVQGDRKMQEHILIAEDDAGLRLSLSFVLKNKGYRITQVADGKEALDRLTLLRAQGDEVDLLITDIQMPVMNGMDLIRRLDEAGSELPVVVITGHGDKEMLIELLRLGCDDFLSKPFEPDEVQEKVAQVLEKKRIVVQARNQEEQHLRQANLRLGREVQAYRRDLKDLRGEMERAVRTYTDLMNVDKKAFRVPLDYRSRPYRDLGGDYLGVCDSPLGCDVMVADVAGHDLASSYQTVLIKSQFDEHCRMGGSGEDFFRDLNRELLINSSEERMVTAIFVHLDLMRGRARVVSAGHPRLLLYRRGMGQAESVVASGSVLGLLTEVEFEPVELELEQGDRLFLYTDGLLNAHNVDGPSGVRHVLGERGLMRALEIYGDADLSEHVNNVWRFGRSFCRYRQSDDMLLLGLEIPPLLRQTEGEQRGADSEASQHQ